MVGARAVRAFCEHRAPWSGTGEQDVELGALRAPSSLRCARRRCATPAVCGGRAARGRAACTSHGWRGLTTDRRHRVINEPRPLAAAHRGVLSPSQSSVLDVASITGWLLPAQHRPVSAQGFGGVNSGYAAPWPSVCHPPGRRTRRRKNGSCPCSTTTWTPGPGSASRTGHQCGSSGASNGRWQRHTAPVTLPTRRSSKERRKCSRTVCQNHLRRWFCEVSCASELVATPCHRTVAVRQ